MVTRAGEDRAARSVLLIGILLAALLIGLELAHEGQPALIAADGELAFGRDDLVRVSLGRTGSGPWRLRLDGGIQLVAEGLRRGGSFTAGYEGGELVIDGKKVSGRAETDREGTFHIDDRVYQGRLVFSSGAGPERPLLVLPIEDYLSQVLPGEMPLSYPVAALSAQVIAARSYVANRMQRRRQSTYDVSDSDSSQMFEPLGPHSARAREIVALSRGLVLGYEGKILPAYYSANCGGASRSTKEAFNETPIPPLRGVVCGHCDWSRHHDWTTSLSAADVGAWFGLGGPVQSVSVQEGSGSGYENRLDLRGPGDRKQVPAAELKRRSRGRLKSSWIVGADVVGGKLVLSGRGFGHGVGLCQNGARGLALAGRDAREILAHYYPGADLRRLNSAERP